MSWLQFILNHTCTSLFYSHDLFQIHSHKFLLCWWSFIFTYQLLGLYATSDLLIHLLKDICKHIIYLSIYSKYSTPSYWVQNQTNLKINQHDFMRSSQIVWYDKQYLHVSHTKIRGHSNNVCRKLIKEKERSDYKVVCNIQICRKVKNSERCWWVTSVKSQVAFHSPLRCWPGNESNNNGQYHYSNCKDANLLSTWFVLQTREKNQN